MFPLPHEIYFIKSSITSLMLSGGKIKPREYGDREGYGVRALKGGKLGFAYCSRRDDLGKTLESAAAISKFSPKTGFSFAPKAPIPKVDIYDRRIAEMDEKQLKEILDSARNGAEKYSKNVRIIVGASKEEIKLSNSEEFEGEYGDTSVSVYIEVMDGKGFGYYTNAFTHLPGKYYEMGLHAAEMAKKMRRPRKPEPGEYTVIAEIEVIDELIDVLLPSFLGEWKRRGISILTTKKDEKFFDGKFSIYDDGTLIGTGSRPFDDDGTPAARMPLVKKGVVRNFTYDRENAALEGVDRSGQCNRPGFAVPPGIGYANIEIGTGDYENLEEEFRNALLVYSVQGIHTANRTTGDFGVEVNAGMTVGKKERAVGGFMLTGNIFNLFKNIKGIEKKAKASGSFFSPRIAFGNMRVVS